MRSWRVIHFTVMSFALLFGACASIVNGTSQHITVNSNVAGAEVFFNGDRLGTTPVSWKVKRGGGTLLVRKEGYASQTLSMNTNVSGWIWGNIVTGGVSGTFTDWATGGMYEYAPDNFFANLVPDLAKEYDAQNLQQDA